MNTCSSEAGSGGEADESMYVVTVEFEVRAGHERDFHLRMRQQAEDSLNREADCIQFDVCQAPDDPRRIFLYEVYADEGAFQSHLDSGHFKDFDKTVADWVAAKTVRIWHGLS